MLGSETASWESAYRTRCDIHRLRELEMQFQHEFTKSLVFNTNINNKMVLKNGMS